MPQHEQQPEELNSIFANQLEKMLGKPIKGINNDMYDHDSKNFENKEIGEWDDLKKAPKTKAEERMITYFPNEPLTIGRIETFYHLAVQDSKGSILLGFQQMPIKQIVFKGKVITVEELVSALEKLEI